MNPAASLGIGLWQLAKEMKHGGLEGRFLIFRDITTDLHFLAYRRYAISNAVTQTVTQSDGKQRCVICPCAADRKT